MQPADGREGLRVAEHRLAALRVGEELGQPGHRRHELDAHADERRAAEEQQHRERGGEPGGQGRERIEQDAPDQHAPAAEAGR